jgi:hypothetical protein
LGLIKPGLIQDPVEIGRRLSKLITIFLFPMD